MDRTSRAVGDAILQAVNGVSTDFDLRDLLVGLVRAACELSGARYGALGVIGKSRRELVEFVSEGISDAESERIGQLPTGRGLLGHLIAHHEPLRLDDLSDHPSSSGFPPGHPPMTSFLGVPVRVRDRVFGNLYLTDKSTGTGFTAEDEQAVVALSGLAGLAIDHARLLMRSERRARWLEATAGLPAAVLRTERSEDALDAVLRQAVAAADGASAMAVAPDPDPATLGRFTVRAAVGDSSWNPEETLLVLRPALMLAMASGSTRFAEVPDGGAVMTRLSVDTITRGGLIVIRPRRRAVVDGDDDSDLVSNFAGQASLVLERHHTRRIQQQLAVLAERHRIARDLHDGVTQRLFAVGLQLKVIEKALPAADRAPLRTAMQDLDAAVADVRRSIVDLRPEDQKRRSLRAKIQDLVAEYTPVLGCRPALTVDGPVDTLVEPSIRHHVVAVLREGLSNSARHAAASTVWVDVTVTADRLTCTVSDDGSGVSHPGTRSGLRNLADRAAELGGTLALTGREPRGSTLTWRVPLPAVAAPG